MPSKPKGVKHWGLRTLWCYFIDNHLALEEEQWKIWHKAKKSKLEKSPEQAAKDFAAQTMTNGDAKLANFKFPQPNPKNAIPGTGSGLNAQSRFGMWGDKGLGRIGL